MMSKHTEVRVPERDCLSSVGNLCTKRCNILKSYRDGVCLIPLYYRKCAVPKKMRFGLFNIQGLQRILYFHNYCISRREKKNKNFPITLSVYLFQGYKSMAYILVMCCVSLLQLLQLLYLQSFTEIGIIVHRIYQQSLRSGPQTKIRICVFCFCFFPLKETTFLSTILLGLFCTVRRGKTESILK